MISSTVNVFRVDQSQEKAKLLSCAQSKKIEQTDFPLVW